MPAASMPRACSWLFGVSLFAEIKQRHERMRWLPVARIKARWERVRDHVVADVPGPPARAPDFGGRTVAEDAVLEPNRLALLDADSDQLIDRCRTVLVGIMPVCLDDYATMTSRGIELYVGYAAARLDWSGS
jgi:hypothetical protein